MLKSNQKQSIPTQAALAMERWTYYLGAGLVNLVHAYDPDVVIVGGGMLHSRASILGPVEAYVQALRMDDSERLDEGVSGRALRR